MSSESRHTTVSMNLVIFLTGFTFLLYEVSWHRLLSLVLGATVTASTIVLASFMAGFGMGAFFWGRIGNRVTRIGRLLAFLLAGVGLASGLNYFVIARGIPLIYATFATNDGGSALVEIPVFLIACGMLFLPAFMMGGVFPIIIKLLVGPDRSIAASLGQLYAVETAGSVIGGLVTGFLLLGTLGQASTIAVAIAINLLLAIWLGLSRRYDLASPADHELSAASSESRKMAPRALAIRRTALLGTVVCGFSILGLQVLWFRMFRIYLTNTSYAFALVSSIAILGLFVGSVWFKRVAKDDSDHVRSMLRVMLMMASSVGVGLVLLVNLPVMLMFPFQSLLADPIARVLLFPILASLLIVFPPAAFSGYAFPLACRMYAGSRSSISGEVGFVMMVNTVGTVMGPIVATFLLLPLLGAAASILLMILLLVGASALVLHRFSSPEAPKSIGIVLYTVIIALVATLVVRPDMKILPPSFARFDRELLFYRESVEGTLSVGRDKGAPDGTKHSFVNNSAVIGSTYDAIKIVKMVGHLPFFLGLDCRDVLVIGFGIGVTTSAIAAHSEVESIECVELVEGLKDAAVYYQELNRNVVHDPRLKIIPGDGRHYLQRTSKKYDLISCDPTHPILGSGSLYTSDYFKMCRDHLNPGGMVSQYLPLHKLRTEEFLGIIATFHSVFPNCSVWLGHFHAVLLGSTGAMRAEFQDWAMRIDSVGRDEHFYSEPHHLAATLVLDSAAIARLSATCVANTDDLSYTEFFDPACLDADNIAKNLRFLMDNRVGPDGVFRGIGDYELMARFIHGNRLLTESLYLKLLGDKQRSLQLLQQAIQINPEDQEYPFLLQLYR